MDWKIGDTVQLKSGGPAMTVTAVNKTDASNVSITCHWFASDASHHESFPPGALVEFSKPERKKRPTDVY